MKPCPGRKPKLEKSEMKETEPKIEEVNYSSGEWPNEKVCGEALLQISKILCGLGAVNHGAILAELVGRWINGHYVPGASFTENKVYREALLKSHFDAILQTYVVDKEDTLN
jgi:hypothetical protein